jgi:hypothetical protein
MALNRLLWLWEAQAVATSKDRSPETIRSRGTSISARSGKRRINNHYSSYRKLFLSEAWIASSEISTCWAFVLLSLNTFTGLGQRRYVLLPQDSMLTLAKELCYDSVRVTKNGSSPLIYDT